MQNEGKAQRHIMTLKTLNLRILNSAFLILHLLFLSFPEYRDDFDDKTRQDQDGS